VRSAAALSLYGLGAMVARVLVDARIILPYWDSGLEDLVTLSHGDLDAWEVAGLLVLGGS
jgi:hypothetical protein